MSFPLLQRNDEISGLLAGGITQGLDDAHGIASWRWLFIVEGCMTVAVSIVCMFLLPDWPGNTRWLTDAEKRLATLRIEADRIGPAGQHDLTHMESFKAAVSDWRTYMFTFMYMMIGARVVSSVLRADCVESASRRRDHLVLCETLPSRTDQN